VDALRYCSSFNEVVVYSLRLKRSLPNCRPLALAEAGLY
jgi:hypothetical protein